MVERIIAHESFAGVTIKPAATKTTVGPMKATKPTKKAPMKLKRTRAKMAMKAMKA